MVMIFSYKLKITVVLQVQGELQNHMMVPLLALLNYKYHIPHQVDQAYPHRMNPKEDHIRLAHMFLMEQMTV